MLGPYSYEACSVTLSSDIFQLKIEEEEDEERKNSRVSQERQKTLDRLRTFQQVSSVLLTLLQLF